MVTTEPRHPRPGAADRRLELEKQTGTRRESLQIELRSSREPFATGAQSEAATGPELRPSSRPSALPPHRCALSLYSFEVSHLRSGAQGS
jgi:hypothetical protein